ncbi:MAG: DUF4160 domain-containing protein [Nitrosomonas sp.]|nr:DUF4160 domain-containing protein [Nitrosomonas sp.]
MTQTIASFRTYNPIWHSYAEYQGHVAVYAILNSAVLAGALPPKKYKLIVAWIEIHQDDLLAD